MEFWEEEKIENLNHQCSFVRQPPEMWLGATAYPAALPLHCLPPAVIPTSASPVQLFH